MTDSTAIELLRKHHEYARDWRHYVASDERHWVDGGDALHWCVKWYYQSDLCKQTAAVLSGADGESVSLKEG